MAAPTMTGTRIRLQSLTYVDDRDGVMVGRPETGSYALFPPEGAKLLRALEGGTTIDAAARQWQIATGNTLDVDDFRDVIGDLGFVVPDGEEPREAEPVRWQRLGALVFSWPMMAAYAAIVAVGVGLMVTRPELRPGYRNVFFTSNIALIPVVLAVTQFPLLLLHEGFHALAARRLGLPSTLGVGRRFYYLVAETRLDSLYSVPRSQRYLVFFAGSIADAVGVGAFTIVSAAAPHWGAPPWVGGLALALAFSGVLRIVWECLFYLETDYYFAINAATGCTDLHGAATSLLRARIRKLVRRPHVLDEQEWTDRDRAAARWFTPLMVGGYGLSLFTLAVVGVPTAVRFWSTVVDRLDGAEPLSAARVVDTAFFVAMSVAELALLAHVTLRDLRRRVRRPSITEGNPS